MDFASSIVEQIQNLTQDSSNGVSLKKHQVTPKESLRLYDIHYKREQSIVAPTPSSHSVSSLTDKMTSSSKEKNGIFQLQA